MKQKISAPANRAVRVEVYEPRQTPEQEEVILDTFDLYGGQEIEVEFPSATAAYRTTVLADDERPDAPEPDDDELEDAGVMGKIAAPQKRELTAGTQAEIEAGKEAAQRLREQDEQRQKASEPEEVETKPKGRRKASKKASEAEDDPVRREVAADTNGDGRIDSQDEPRQE